MSALDPRRRKITAKEVGARVGISERHVRRLAAEPRAEFLARAKARRLTAARLRIQGLSYAEIAAKTNTTSHMARQLVCKARKLGEWAMVASERDSISQTEHASNSNH